MGIYVTRRCPNCKYVLERMARDYIAIGNPFITCPKCSQIITLDHVNEWDDLGFWWKVRYILTEIYTCIFWSMGVVLLLSAVVVYFPYLFDDNISRILLGVMYIIGLVSIFLYRTDSMIEEIKKSKERTSNSNHEEKKLNR